MSHNVHTEIVPHLVVVDGWEPWFEMITNRESWIELEQERLAEEEGEEAADAFEAPTTVDLQGTGWTLTAQSHGEWEHREMGKGSVWGSVIRKGDSVVVAFNSDRGSHVGEMELSVCADKLDHLIEFCVDLKLRYDNVESPGAAKLWY